MHEFEELVILYTSDSHCQLFPSFTLNKDFSTQLKWCSTDHPTIVGGFSYLATLVKKYREKYPHVLLLDSGDSFSDSMIANKTKGKLPLIAMNSLHYDAMTPGNHDIDYGLGQLKKLSKAAKFPLLAANLLDEFTLSPLLGKAYLLKKFHSTTVAIYGLTYHLTPETTSRKNIKGAKYELDFQKIERDLTEIKKQGVELILILSHLGSEVDEELAKQVKNIDIIIGGHSHDPQPTKIVNGVIIAQTTPYFSGLGMLKLLLRQGKIVKHKGRIIPILPEKIEPDLKIEQMLNDTRILYENELNEVIGYSHSPLVRSYKSESPIDTFIGNVLRKMTRSEISILPGRGFGLTIPSGYVTREEITNFIPHGSKVYKVLLKGKDILEALEQSILNQINQDVTKRVGGLIQITGLNFVYTFSEQINPKISHVYVNGIALNPEQTYTVVLNQLMYEGGHQYRSLKKGQLLTKYQLKDNDMVIYYIKHHSPITVHKEGWSIPLIKTDQKFTQKTCLPF